ncbi:MAG TPA: 2-amino-4-hydroxy-6-hydroxymethyldihydropteridine diphosphokinase, partial [Firmicutes bacterium]|nr:2-amino-4-hydroxy-6-hydroxymethyldihydropteridine diphosphokinase [Bacillota bacterium]
GGSRAGTGAATVKGVYVGLGSNLGDRAGNLFQARRSLAALPRTRLIAVSPVYETEPVGVQDQDWFLNQVVELETDLGPEELLRELMRIEAGLGRVRTVRWGPRTLDLDLLLYGAVSRATDFLALPHPRMWERAFVLQPLSDVAPGLRTPAGEPVGEAAQRLAGTQTVAPWKPRLVDNMVEIFDEVDSTNAEAWRLAGRGATSGAAIIAGRQTQGRGRQGHSWHSPAGLGLYLSVLLRPEYLRPAEAPAFTLLGAVAARRTAAALGAPQAALKWPNDLVVATASPAGEPAAAAAGRGGTLRKLGGVLAETASQGSRLAVVVLGIGLNLNHRPEDFPPELREKAVSLAQLGAKRIPVKRASAVLLDALNDTYLAFLSGGEGDLHAEYHSHLTPPGWEYAGS